MLLSPHFTLAEFTRSQLAARRGIPNEPPAEAIPRLRLVCEMVLEQVRSHFGQPVLITSGYRSEQLSIALGSNRRSQHGRGEAADFEVPGVTNATVARWIRDNLEFDQLILEAHDGHAPQSGWVHCSYTKVRPLRRSVLSWRSEAGYRSGLDDISFLQSSTTR